MCRGWVVGGMPDDRAFDGAAFLGLSRRAKRDPYRLELLARHFDLGERALVLLAVRGGTLVVTDRRVLEFRAHLEDHGPWNVRQFLGYVVAREFDRAAVRDVAHRVRAAGDGTQAVEDALEISLGDRAETVLVSRGPEATLPSEDFGVLRAAVLGQAK